MAVSCGSYTTHVAKTQFALALEWSTYVEVIVNLPHCRGIYSCMRIGLRELIFFFCVFLSCFLLCVHSLCLYFPVFHFNFLPFLFNILIMVFHFFGSSCPRAEKEYYLPGRISCLILRFWCFFKHATVCYCYYHYHCIPEEQMHRTWASVRKTPCWTSLIVSQICLPDVRLWICHAHLFFFLFLFLFLFLLLLSLTASDMHCFSLPSKEHVPVVKINSVSSLEFYIKLCCS